MTSNNGGPSGRSPFPAGPRRRNHRSSFESFTEESHSPFLNNLLRFSPKNASLSPLNRNSVTNAGQSRRARFFDSKAPPGATTTPIHAAATNGDEQFSPDSGAAAGTPGKNEPLDGIPLDHLRSLTQSSLLTSPTTAVVYASIVYAKTHAAGDALVLARAHCAAHQMDACLRILEESGLLLQQQQDWQAVLVACQALAYQEEWNILIDLLEDVCRTGSAHSSSSDGAAAAPTFSQLASGQPIEDTDHIGWLALQRSIRVATPHEIHPLALLCWHRGRAYYETGCSLRATTFWKLALAMDCRCQAAWEALLHKNLLSVQEAHHVVMHEMEFSQEQEWLRAFYIARIELTPQEPASTTTTTTTTATVEPAASMLQQDTSVPASFAALDASSIDASSMQISSPMHIHTPTGFKQAPPPPPPDTKMAISTTTTTTTAPPQIQKDVDDAFTDLWNKYKLQDAPQILAMAARRAYRRYEWKKALQYCQDLAQLNPSLDDAAFCYVATLIHLGHKRVLFRLAHEWVDANPQSAPAWFAVGAYYYCIGRYHIAQRHFCRATRLDPQCPEAWIAFGCSFAACDESDQALASFRAAQRLSPGEHASLLYMGMEYVRTNHRVLAHYFLHAARTASGGDPLCLHELGVLAAHTDEAATAVHWFSRALTSALNGATTLEDWVDVCTDPYWEPTFFNLGHALRKLRRYEEAEQCYQKCIALCPDNCAPYTALGFTYHMVGLWKGTTNSSNVSIDRAISLYHQALSLKPDDPFSSDMLHKALETQVELQARRLMDLPPLQETKQRPAVPAAAWKEESSTMSEGMDDSDMDMH